MATLMRATQPHWQGNKFVDVGTVLPQGHPDVIESLFEAFEVDTPAEAREKLIAEAEDLGIKVDRRKSDDTLRAEIADAKAASESTEEE